MTSIVTYLGDLRTTSTHLQSGTVILSDAPTDNHGKGEAFSPTDLLCNSLASCLITIMALKSKDLNVNLEQTTAEVTKFMQTEPRRVSKIKIVMNMPIAVSDKNKIILEKIAMNCPVMLSLHPDIEKDVTFIWKSND